MSLLDLVPARRGHFAYESGHHGDTWLDLDTLFVRPAPLAPHCAELARRLAAYGVSAVCGPLTGGAFAAQAVAVELDARFAWTTWPGYTLPGPLAAAVAGRRVAIVDDAVNAGSAVLATASALTTAGATVAAVGALLVLDDAATVVGKALDVPVEHLATLPTSLWPAPACPLCAAGAPLDDPTS